jgi:hypothetical protein
MAKFAQGRLKTSKRRPPMFSSAKYQEQNKPVKLRMNFCRLAAQIRAYPCITFTEPQVLRDHESFELPSLQYAAKFFFSQGSDVQSFKNA